ncbi:hypothetical protein SYNPS1DRAFT_22644 [Syncephalis pseudoplumigaleata]|uniref:PIN domain-containing protein n=1 Tax=Syncephalis pseudoplumigaleata TaxID=1712513 RepID=A0A4P9YYZ9_9FUNG|nr:hypothetical protein SYNPS1DRAFT_22644 [Syncephalis pseudoplumigaleata]|eukprot:RKP25383.1 hypothetical protein SYNPS1DRAFT_22644 [Syncephalis pseudoplumigaleata]
MAGGEHVVVPTPSPPLPEDFELQGFAWAWTILARTDGTTLATWDSTRRYDVEDAVELIDTDYGHWEEPEKEEEAEQQQQQHARIEPDDEPTDDAMRPWRFEELLDHRRRRLIALGHLLVKMVPVLAWSDEQGPLADLKAKKRELETLTTLLIDTNMFIRDLAIIKQAIESRRWTIILPLAVVIELDGLRKSESALGVAAREAIAYLEDYFATPVAQRLGDAAGSSSASSTLTAASLPVRVQTAKGNYLPNIQYRSETFHRDDTADRWGDYSSTTVKHDQDDETVATMEDAAGDEELRRLPLTKTLDDIILEVCQLHPAESSALVTDDANLRVKAHAYAPWTV